MEVDIVERLRAQRAGRVQKALMLEAAETIETLRVLVGIRAEIELEDAEPEGNA